MSLKVSLILCTLVVVASGRPRSDQVKNLELSGERGLDYNKQHDIQKRDAHTSDSLNVSDYATALHALGQINMNINSNELSEYLRCTSCLTECVSVKNPLSYYLCRTCIESCANRTDAFMHFFSAHQCKVTPQTPTGQGNPPKQILGSPLWEDRTTTSPATTVPDNEYGRVGQNKVLNHVRQTTESYDYLDQYMQKRYFSDDSADNCSIRRKKYQEMESKYSQCMTDLGNCNSNWPKHPYDATDYGEMTYPGIDYPDYPDQNPDRERSNLPTRPQLQETSTTNFPQVDSDMLAEIATTNPELAAFIRQNPEYMTNSTGQVTPLPTKNVTTEMEMRIINKYKSLFVTRKEYTKLTKEKWGKKVKKLANIKSAGRRYEDEETDQKKEVCPATFKVQSPLKVAHRSGEFAVKLMQTDEWAQPFIVADCSFKKPTVGVLQHAVCDTVPVQRIAVVIVEREREHLFSNCEPYDPDGHYFYCRDWIDLPGACSLFL